uniref:TPT domain-containing protein n=1 Tax=Macrostomum lignano TaxID=282301 RepID=A0A1I8IBJ7_9PLAT
MAPMLSAYMYALFSFLMVIANKLLLTSYLFPSPAFLCLTQVSSTCLFLLTARAFGIVQFGASLSDAAGIFPLPIYFFGNLVFGLSGTQVVSLPMFTVLRRLCILMTFIGELIFLQRRGDNRGVGLAVFLMLLGASIAAMNDLTFDLAGYAFLMLNNLFTAAYGITVKLKTGNLSGLSKYGILYHCCSIAVLPCLALNLWTGEFSRVADYRGWSLPVVWALFCTSNLLQLFLLYSTIQCTADNGPLTTTVIGVLKNVLVTYLGMFIGRDYVFTLHNFMGLNVSTLGGVLYTYLTFKAPKVEPQKGTVIVR